MLKEGNIAASVFCTRTGQFIRKSDVARQVLKPLLRKANETAVTLAEKTGSEPVLIPDVRFHDLRHTHATTLLRAATPSKPSPNGWGMPTSRLLLRSMRTCFHPMTPRWPMASIACSVEIGYKLATWAPIGAANHENRECRKLLSLRLFYFQFTPRSSSSKAPARTRCRSGWPRA